MAKNKTVPAPTITSATANAAKIIQAEKEKRANRTMEQINAILKQENCTIGVAIVIRPGQYPQGNIEIVALDEPSKP